MAEQVNGGDWQKRYGGIESAYLQGRWSTVLETGTILLRELLAEESPEAMALRHRTQLLIAHTLLHGFGDRDAAEDLYEVVRNSDAEPVLRQMAMDGLDQCHQPLPSTLAVEEDGEDDWGPSQPLLFIPEEERADLEEDDSGQSEPRKSDSLASQMPLLPMLGKAVASNPEEAPSEAPVDRGADDIQETSPIDLGVAADPFSAGTIAPSARPEQDLPAMPWLPDPAGGGGMVPAVLGGMGSQALTVDVVDEPELIEVHQSNPSWAEEVDVEVQQELSPPPPDLMDQGDDGDLRTGLLLVVVD